MTDKLNELRDRIVGTIIDELHGGAIEDADPIYQAADIAIKEVLAVVHFDLLDALRLSKLEQLIRDNGGVRLHHGEFEGQHVGIGLDNTGRTLREALDASLGIEREDRND